MDFPDNYEQRETEYNRHHDPYAEIACLNCMAVQASWCVCEPNVGEGELE
jgi:hypothetical protein